MTERVGVAISTTGHEHRMGFLETCVEAWRKALPLGSTLVVTVDGTEADAERVRVVVDAPDGGRCGGNTYRAGQPQRPEWSLWSGRQGVAVNKNTGIELLMDAGVEHLFLCDDDAWPLYPQSLDKHIALGYEHSMVCWGGSRLKPNPVSYAEWTWPRGVMLYQTREVVARVGGMVEDFGIGGHEHAEYSQRIHNAGFTPAPFISPASYATRKATGAAALWHCEDMRKPGELSSDHGHRRTKITSVDTKARDWAKIQSVMDRMEGSTAFVPYRARENGRASATL